MRSNWRPQWVAAELMPRVAVMAAVGLGISMVCVISARVLAADDAEAVFLKENDLAMSRMMAAMAIKPSGDVDSDFVAAMIPHHQGAIEMAQAELRHGRNEQVRRIAQEIIVEQTQEIAAMRLAVSGSARGPVAMPTEPRQ